MTSPPTNLPTEGTTAQTAAAAAAAALSGVILVGVSAPGPSWLDSAELIAAARELGGIHPPGHPAWLSLSALAELLPLGPYGARVVWLSACLGAVCTWFVARLAQRALKGFSRTSAGAWWSFCAALVFTCSGTLWLVGARAEVYALALATNLWALDAALRAGDQAAREVVPRSLTETSIAIALGLLNHHYITLFGLPAVIAAAWPALRTSQRDRRALWHALVSASVLGIAYIGPSLRALADTEMRWGDPASVSGFWDTVTAAHFQTSVTQASVDVFDNLAVLLGAIVANMGIWPALLGLIGVGVGSLRRDRDWLALVLALLGALATKSLMAISTSNPDDYGYTAMAAVAFSVGVAYFGGVLFDATGPLRNLSAHRRNRLSVFILPWIFALSLLNGGRLATDPNVNLAGMRAPDVIDDAQRGDLSPGTLLLTNYVFTGFNEQAWRIAEGRRPDVTATHLSFRTGDTDGGKRFNQWLGARRPDLRSLSVAASRLERAPVGNMLPLAERFDVHAELDVDNRLPAHSYSFGGFSHRLLRSEERTLDDRPVRELDRREVYWKALESKLTAHGRLDIQTKQVLSWQHALQAAHALRRGWIGIAREEVALGRQLAPQARTFDRLLKRAEVLNDAVAQRDKRRLRTLLKRYHSMTFDELSRGAP